MSSFQGDFIKKNNKIIFKVKDIDVSSYANYYELLFDGFDDCNTSDEELSDFIQTMIDLMERCETDQ